MRRSSTPSVAKLGLMALGLLFVLVLSGCGGGGNSNSAASVGSAKSGLSAAESALSTLAPDAKLLVIQTATTVSGAEQPIWAYVFGSPKTGKVYTVLLTEDKVMHANESGEAKLSADEWAAIPGADSIKIDSQEAYDKALAESGIEGTPSSYTMLVETHVPKSAEGSNTKALTWYVSFEASGGQMSDIYRVDAKTGEVNDRTQVGRNERARIARPRSRLQASLQNIDGCFPANSMSATIGAASGKRRYSALSRPAALVESGCLSSARTYQPVSYASR